MARVTPDLAARLYQRARAERWGLPIERFVEALERSAARAPSPDEASSVARYLDGLHLEDLALACACERGDEAAWEHFVREFRPALYRAAGAMDSSGGGRELADSLYAELFGLKERDGQRQSLFRYFHGRSSLGTWLRAILAQRHVDGIRAGRRLDSLPEDDAPGTPVAPAADPGPDRSRLLALVHAALAAALTGLAPRDRLRLGWYYAEGMTLAQIGRVLGEHEATVSRSLSRTRKALRAEVERRLEADGLGQPEVDECFAAAADDPGTLDLGTLLTPADERKTPQLDRSESEGVS